MIDFVNIKMLKNIAWHWLSSTIMETDKRLAELPVILNITQLYFNSLFGLAVNIVYLPLSWCPTNTLSFSYSRSKCGDASRKFGIVILAFLSFKTCCTTVLYTLCKIGTLFHPFILLLPNPDFSHSYWNFVSRMFAYFNETSNMTALWQIVTCFCNTIT